MENGITIDPATCNGKPCIRGLRYSVESVLGWLASGMSIDDILADYAELERDDIHAALTFANYQEASLRGANDALQELADQAQTLKQGY